jgi:hypothetical protein
MNPPNEDPCNGFLCAGHANGNTAEQASLYSEYGAASAPFVARKESTEPGQIGWLYVGNSTKVAFHGDGTVTYTDPDGTTYTDPGDEYESDNGD